MKYFYRFFLQLFFILGLLASPYSWSQNTTTTLSVDNTYDIGTGPRLDGTVILQAVQPDGKIIILGNFNECNGVGRRYIARINPNGTLDASFDPGTSFTSIPSSNWLIKIQPDGKILIAGAFASFAGVSKAGLLRLTSTGALDTAFNTGSGPSSTPTSMDVQSDGKILLAGPTLFTYAGFPINNVCRLNAITGALDNTFSPSTFGGTQQNPAQVRVVKVQSVGGADKILVAGTFDTYAGNTANKNIIRLNLDGSRDTNFNSGSSVQGSISQIEITPLGNLLLLGAIANYASATTLGLIQLSSSGTLDQTFNAGGAGFTVGGNYSIPTAMAVRNDGKIAVVGPFTSYNGTARNFVALINADGTIDTGYDPGTSTINSQVSSPQPSSVVISSDGDILLGGSFITYNGSAAPGYTKVSVTGTVDTVFNTNTALTQKLNFFGIFKQADDKLLVRGNFSSISGTAVNFLARLNTNGTVDTSFNPGGAGPNNPPSVLAQQPDGKILIAGTFTTYNGVSRLGIARLNTDGTLDTSFDPGAGLVGSPSPTVRTVLPLVSGKILVGGNSFSTYNTMNNISGKNLIQLNADGSFDTAYTVLDVHALAQQADGNILVGGGFTSFSGTPANRIVRMALNGTVDTSFNSGGVGLNSGNASTIILQPNDQKIILGGSFTTYNSITSNGMLRLNTDGTLDNTFSVGTGLAASTSFNQILRLSDGKILFITSSSTFNGTPINRIARLNIDGSLDTSFSAGASGATGVYNPNLVTPTLTNVAIQSDGKLLLMGGFSAFNGSSKNGLVRVTPVTTSTLSTVNAQAPQFLLYPNPAKDFVTISNINRGSEVSLYDMTGKLLYTTRALSSTVTLNTSSYQNGMYMVKVNGQTTKLLISK